MSRLRARAVAGRRRRVLRVLAGGLLAGPLALPLALATGGAAPALAAAAPAQAAGQPVVAAANTALDRFLTNLATLRVEFTQSLTDARGRQVDALAGTLASR